MTKNKDNQPVECKFVGLSELKFASSDEEMTFAGYGAVFGNVDSHDDVIAKGAFAETLKKAQADGNWPAMLSQHGGMFGDGDTPIGVWTEMREDDIGLWIEGKFAPTEKGKEAYALLKMKPRPAFNGLSIGYRAKEWARGTEPGEPRRTLKAVELLEVSLVTFPSNGKARVLNVKSDFNPRLFEDSLRDAGLSRGDSVKAVAVFKEMLRRDDDEPTDGLCDGDDTAEKSDAVLKTLAERIRALAA